MATVIDSLLIELGLDTSKFNQEQKKSVQELRKFDEQAQKTSKNTQQGAKDIGEGFAKSRDALISLGVALVGFKGFTNFVQTMTTGNAALGRNANLLGLSARELDAWGGVLGTVGGNLDSFQSSLQNMESGLANIKLGDSAILTPLARLGALGAVDLNKNTVDIYKLADAIKKVADQDKQLALSLSSQMGISKEMFMILSQGSDQVRRLYGEQYQLSGVNEKNTESAQKLQAEWAKVKQAFSGASNQVMDNLYPALEGLAKVTVLGLEKFVEYDKKLNGLITNVGLFAASLGTLHVSLKAIGVTLGSGVWAGLTRFFGGAALLLHSGNLNEGEDEELKKIWEKYDREHGTKNGKPSSGPSAGGANLPRNLRNNNPGNIEYGDFARRMGATGSDGRFAIFPNMKAGEDAMANLLMGYMQSGNNTISKIVGKWSPAKENGMANTTAYINDVSKRTGIDPNKPLSMGELGAVRQAMSQHEGSSSSVQTNIGTINVQTQATDGKGVALDLGKSLQNNSLINYGMQGNR
ncbi:hypothetical protein UFOVP148_54 [uncultured Caudovirales phage]|uniref:Uncharacterized protein n=1 Tax=uncultured Caudovirales phage TaxID=2100421 RepID=A0A6J7W505_9CAUD|nr:hypothetical protein UFOVP148_54 [uncultured Caudovirales phage]